MAWAVWITKPHHSKLSSKPDPDFPGVTNEFTDKNEQASLDVCGALGVKPIAMVNTQKERYPAAEFLKNPVSWLETESLDHSLQNAERGSGGRSSWPQRVVSSTKAFEAHYPIQHTGTDPVEIQNIWQTM